jgi:hypothetical protein
VPRGVDGLLVADHRDAVGSQRPTVARISPRVSLAGWGIVLTSTLLINHLDLFGLRQVFMRLRERQPAPYSL